MTSITYTVDQVKQLYSISRRHVKERLNKGVQIYTDDQSIDQLKAILVASGVEYALKSTDMAGLNVHEVTIS